MGVTQAVGGVAATLEVIDKRTLCDLEFHRCGLPGPRR